MRKIRNIKQLKREQRKLQDRQVQLAKEMGDLWRQVKKSMRPHNIAKDLAGEWVVNKLTSRGIGRLLQLFF